MKLISSNIPQKPANVTLFKVSIRDENIDIFIEECQIF